MLRPKILEAWMHVLRVLSPFQLYVDAYAQLPHFVGVRGDKTHGVLFQCAGKTNSAPDIHPPVRLHCTDLVTKLSSNKVLEIFETLKNF